MELAPFAGVSSITALFANIFVPFQPPSSHILLKNLSLFVILYITFLNYFNGYIYLNYFELLPLAEK